MITDAIKIRRDSQLERFRFQKARIVERQYAVQLRKVARHVGEIVRAYPIDDIHVLPEVMHYLRRYADYITPWARVFARRMLLEIGRRDEKAFNDYAKKMAVSIGQELRTAPTGQLFQKLQYEQVELIRSIPIKAAQRIHNLTQEYLAEGRRAEELVSEIMKTGLVSQSHAELIAVTEVSRAATNFTQARAQHLGSEAYVWETARDSRVREQHRKLQGRVFFWNDPPVIGTKGERGAPGTIYRCRCWPRPLFSPEEIAAARKRRK